MILLKLLIGLNAVLHFWFMTLEMFFWTKPLGLKTFGLRPEFAQASAGLAKNQGLYNGFLAAGLAWSLLTQDPFLARSVQLFFLSCVSVAGIYGALTVKPKIFFIQALPALVTLALVFFSKRSSLHWYFTQH